MYLPKLQQKKKVNHFQFTRSRRQLIGGGIIGVLVILSGAVYALGKLRGRERQSQIELARTHPGQRVVILGGGLGGCALAGNLCNADPELHVTVVDAQRRYLFQGLVPLAHVGHRSYDLNTSGAVDFLSSPLSWNVTRRANMVLGEVVCVRPEKKEVIVRGKAVKERGGKSTAEGSFSRGKGEGDVDSTLPWWRRFIRSPSPPPSRNPDGSLPLSDGCVAYPYDVLVVAAGAQRTLGPLADFLKVSNLDCYRIAVNPGVTRDSLVHLYKGNVLHVKVPPTSFVRQMEQIRRKLLPPAIRISEEHLKEASRVYLEKGNLLSLMTPTIEKVCTDKSSRNTLAAADKSFLTAWCSCKSSTDSAASSSTSNHDKSSSQNFVPYMHYPARQHEGTFVSSTNLIWKYLHYFSKLSFCTLYTIVADAEPLGPASRSVNNIIRDHWSNMQTHSYRALKLPSTSTTLEGGEVSAKVLADLRFFFLSHSYLTDVDLIKNEATVYNYAYNALISIPFGLILLDLPLCAPSFIRESGLHRKDYAREHIPAFLSTSWWNAVAAKMVNPADGANLFRWMSTVQKIPPVRNCFRDEEGFVDVYPDTLQHRRYENIFALGDVAGLPTMKSYGSTLAQVPVVAHNVLQVVRKQKILQRMSEVGKNKKLGSSQDRGKGSLQEHTPQPETTAVEGGGVHREANARYNGYSSFHVCMTPWRAMWPEMEYNQQQVDAFQALHDVAGTKNATRKDHEKLPLIEGEDPVLAGNHPLRFCNHHIWDNLAWKDFRGVLNALFYQSGLYEILFFVLLNSGSWYPPGWLSVPTFSPVDGSIEPPRTRFSWL